MSKYSNFIPSSVISKIKYSTDDELIKATKKLYLKEIENKHGGKNFLEIIASKYEINGSDLVDALSGILKLSEVYYYLAYSFTAKQSKEVCTFNSKNIQFNTEIFNDFGQPIWIEKLTESPKLWNAIKEDNKDHIFLTYIHLGVENTYFDPVTLFFEKYNETALINYRVHFEDNIIEISSKNSNQTAIRDSLTNLSQIFKLADIEFKAIKDEDIRNFDSIVEKVTYERREGDEASASMTRVNKDSDTRKDSLRTELNNREFRKEHGLLILENDIGSVVGLSSGERGKIQIKSHLNPENQIIMVHKIKDILRW